jgi:hypothetical protein
MNQLPRRSLIGGIVLIAAGCLFSRPSRDEVARVRSPSGDIEGLVVETNGGATVSFGYEVHMVQTGRPMSSGPRVALLYGARRNANAFGVNLKWIGPNSLAIEYLEAKSVRIEDASPSIAGRLFKVALVAGINDPIAPAGGMLYNLKKVVSK